MVFLVAARRRIVAQIYLVDWLPANLRRHPLRASNGSKSLRYSHFFKGIFRDWVP